MVEIAAWLGVVVLVLVALVYFAGRASDRVWDDESYERERRGGTALGNAALGIRSLFEPGAKHALEERITQRVDDVESGDPPSPGHGNGDRIPPQGLGVDPTDAAG